jgi:hypothetical protein
MSDDQEPSEAHGSAVALARLAVLAAPESAAKRVALAALSEPADGDGSRAQT